MRSVSANLVAAILGSVTSPYTFDGGKGDIYTVPVTKVVNTADQSSPVQASARIDQLGQIDAMSRPNGVSTKELTLDKDGKLRLEDFASGKPNLSDLHALFDYATGLDKIVIYKDYDHSCRAEAFQNMMGATKIAKREFKESGYDKEALSNSIALLLEKHKLPNKLSSEQKVFITRAMYDAKKGRVDPQLMSALDSLRAIPLTPKSQAEIDRTNKMGSPEYKAELEAMLPNGSDVKIG